MKKDVEESRETSVAMSDDDEPLISRMASHHKMGMVIWMTT